MTSLYKLLFLILNRRQKINFFFISVMIFFSFLLETLGIGTILPLAKIIISEQSSTGINYIDNYLVKYSTQEIFVIFLIIFFGFFLIKNLVVSIILFFQIRIIYQIKKILSETLFKKFLFEEYKYIIDNNSSYFLNKLVQNTNDFINSIKFIINFFSDITFIIILTCLLFYLNPLFTTIIVLLVYIPSQIVVYYRKKKQKELGLVKDIHQESNILNIQETLDSIREIKLLKIEQYFLNIYKLNTLAICKSEAKQFFFASLPKFFIEIIAISILVITLIVLSIYSFDSFKQTIPKLAVFTVASFRIIPCLSRLLESQQMVNFFKKSTTNIFKELKNHKYKINTKLKKNISFPKFITFKNVNFEYENKKIILKDINFKFRLNGLIGIYGKTGVGKTTLINLMTGFLRPKSGEVLIDKSNLINDVNILNYWQSIIGYVPQTVNILNNSLIENVAIGQNKSNYDMKRFQKVIDICQIEDSLREKEKLFTGESGAKISGGQKQKIAIARSLYFNRKIIFFDESTNAMDKLTQKQIIQNIINSKLAECLIFISHDKTIIKNCEQKILLN
jgi:ABC-type bacteriocin/lantibiotic exporter with double-glycine peptidase domain